MSKWVRSCTFVVTVLVLSPSLAKAQWGGVPLSYGCGWTCNPTDPCGVYSTTCCGETTAPPTTMGFAGIFGRRPRFPAWPSIWARRQARVMARRTRLANRRAALAARRMFNAPMTVRQRQRLFYGPSAIYSAGSCGMAVPAAIPMTTQVPVTTYRMETVDMGSYQRVWVPNIVTRRVPQTIYQPHTTWTCPSTDCCGPSVSAPTYVAPSAPLGGTIMPQSPIVGPGGMVIDGGVGTPPSPPGGYPGYPSSGAGFEYPVTPAPASSSGTGAPGTDSTVPRPPSGAFRSGGYQSAAIGATVSPYANRTPNYGQPSAALRYAQRGALHPSEHGAVHVDNLGDDEYDDWVKVNPEKQNIIQQSRTVPRYENDDRRSARSSLFSPVRPGSGVARARFAGR